MIVSSFLFNSLNCVCVIVSVLLVSGMAVCLKSVLSDNGFAKNWSYSEMSFSSSFRL